VARQKPALPDLNEALYDQFFFLGEEKREDEGKKRKEGGKFR
jgi:hypothetical protein